MHRQAACCGWRGFPSTPPVGRELGALFQLGLPSQGCSLGSGEGFSGKERQTSVAWSAIPWPAVQGIGESVGTQKMVPGLLVGAGLTTAPEIICWKPIEGATLGPLSCTTKSTRVCKDTRAGGSLATQLEPAWWRRGETEAHLGDLLCVASADVREGRADGKVRMSPHV